MEQVTPKQKMYSSWYTFGINLLSGECDGIHPEQSLSELEIKLFASGAYTVYLEHGPGGYPFCYEKRVDHAELRGSNGEKPLRILEYECVNFEAASGRQAQRDDK